MPRPSGSRLSIAHCRHLLGDVATELSDAAVEQLREQLYVVADYVVWLSQDSPGARQQAHLARLAADDRTEVEERAAILEFDGKMAGTDALDCALSLRVGVGPQRVMKRGLS